MAPPAANNNTTTRTRSSLSDNRQLSVKTETPSHAPRSPSANKAAAALACTHLSLASGACSSCTIANAATVTRDHAAAASPPSKRKRPPNAAASPAAAARKRARHDQTNAATGCGWGPSTELTLYDDPWKIKKVLLQSDLGNMSRLLLPKKLAEELVVPALGAGAESERGVDVRVRDVDTDSTHGLVFKRWGSSGSYVFIGNWVRDFVSRRGLKRGDEIGLHWDPYNARFHFSVLKAV